MKHQQIVKSSATRSLAFGAALVLALALSPSVHAQLHFSEPITVGPAEMMTGNAEVDSQISQFFNNNPGFRLSYNILWTGNVANLDGGVHSINQTATITVGFTTVFARERPHEFSFALEVLQNAEGDFYVRVNWSITDSSASTVPLIAQGVQTVARVLKSQPGIKRQPTRSSPNADTIQFDLNNPTSISAGRWETVNLPAQRVFFRDDGVMVVEGYTVRINIFIPDYAAGGGGDGDPINQNSVTEPTL